MLELIASMVAWELVRAIDAAYAIRMVAWYMYGRLRRDSTLT